MSVRYSFRNGCRAAYSSCLILAHAFLLVPNSSHAGEPVYGRGVSGFSAFAPETAYTTNYKIQGDLDCPTPNIRVGGFAGNANDWANVDGPIPWSSSGLGSYGIATSLSIPLGGQLSDYCKKALTDAGLGRSDGAAKRGEALFALTAFAKNGPLSAFKECEPLYALLLRRNPTRTQPEITSDPRSPAPAPTADTTAPKVQYQNNIN